MQKKIVKKWLLEGKRVDGRTPDEIRPLDAEVGVLPRVHGSGLFTRGQTQVLSVCTLNTLSAAQKLDTIYDETERSRATMKFSTVCARTWKRCANAQKRPRRVSPRRAK